MYESMYRFFDSLNENWKSVLAEIRLSEIGDIENEDTDPAENLEIS